MKFWIVIRGRKCEKYLDKCLKSILKQTYKNYSVVLILDDPPDRSPQIALGYQFSIRHPLPMHIQINDERLGLGQNIWNGIQLCKAADPEDVICFLDADDFLHKEALSTAAAVYADRPTNLITYGSYCKMSVRRRTAVSKRCPTEPIRKSKWATSHFKTVKYKLAKLLPASAMKHNGIWAEAASDRALMYALIDMVGLSRCTKISEAIYYWRDNTPHKTGVDNQRKWDKLLRAKPKLERVVL